MPGDTLTNSISEGKEKAVALKPTIYKSRISLSDLERNYYDTLNLTIAQHPSETLERMMIRVMAFCLNAQENLAFTKGLSEPNEPDIKRVGLDGQLDLWIDVGEPAPDRIKKATRVARQVKVYSFNSKSDVWWQTEASKFAPLSVSVYRIPWPQAQSLAALVDRTMDMSVTVTGDSAYVTAFAGECEIQWDCFQR